MRPAAGATNTPLRLFTALWPNAATRAAIAQWQRAWDWPHQAAPVPADRLHITLHFLGSVPAERLSELKQALRVPFEPFALELVQGKVWPNGVAVLEPDSVPPPLTRLHTALGRTLAGLALPMETRPYRPHVTLARRAKGAIAPPPGLVAHWQASDGYVLVRSMPGGAGYEVLERFS